MTEEISRDIETLCEAYRRASSMAPLPRLWPIVTSLPVLLIDDMELESHVSTATIPMAATDLLPNRPNQAISVKL